MAKRRSAGKIQPAPLTMMFSVTTPPGFDSNNLQFIDLSQCASIMNRRFYRQGLNWAVAGFKCWAAAGQFAEVACQKIPSTWMVSNAWEKCFRSWQRQQREAIADGGNQSIKAAFNDFKIFLSVSHHSNTVSGNLIPFDHTLLGEWDASQIVIPNFGAPGVNYEPYFHMVGDDVGGAGGSLGMVKAYANSRGVPQEPDPATPPGVTSNENYLNLMFDDGDNNEDIIDNVVGKNNDLPYDQLDYPGADVQAPDAAVHDLCQISSTSVGGQARMKGGTFPCGLIQLNVINKNPDNGQIPSDATEVVILVDLVPGPNRGYLTQPMTEM